VASGWIRLPGAVARVGCRDGARHGRLRRRRSGRTYRRGEDQRGEITETRLRRGAGVCDWSI
jgi:hypothetical protein